MTGTARRGRPPGRPIEGETRRSRSVAVRLDEREGEALDQLCQASARTPSEVIRALIMDARAGAGGKPENPPGAPDTNASSQNAAS